MRDTSSDAFIGGLLRGYLARDREPGCFSYSFSIFFILIPIIGFVFSFIEEELIDMFGDFWTKMIVLHVVFLVVITFILIFLEMRTLKNRLNTTMSSPFKPIHLIIKYMLYIVSIVLGYALFVGFDVQLFSQTIHDSLEHSRKVGDGLGSLILTPIYFISIPIEFILKLLIVPIAQFVLVKIILFPYYVLTRKQLR